jgi:hypothetical protein
MNRIEMPQVTSKPQNPQSHIEQIIEKEQNLRKRLVKNMFGYGGILISLFMCFITVMVVTTEISISFDSIASLSTDFFLLLFCSYASYICCADSGHKAGINSKTYADTLKTFNDLQQGIIKKKIHCILGDFCKDYIATELKNAKTYYLVSAGIDYDTYISTYASLDDAEIGAMSGLSTVQKKAIMSANAVKPIKLYPEQIIRQGGDNSRRSPLSISPKQRLRYNQIIKLFVSIFVMLGMSLIALNDITASSWTIFVMICVKFSSVLYNCFSGYKCGYENIVIHSVQYMQEQISLMQQAEIFAERYNLNKSNESESKHICSHTNGVGADHKDG